MRLIALASLAAALLAAPARAADAPETLLLRFPTIHGDDLAFSHGGDLYTAPVKGGIARRLTGHEGNEIFPRYSPDGKFIAFTGQYDGNTEVFVIPAIGGTPRRLTFTATLSRDEVSDRMGPNNIVIGWTPDSKKILFRSRMTTFNDFLGQLYTVDLDGHPPVPLPLPRGGFASYSPDGKVLAFNRVFREFRTWKRYRGGMADDIWLYDFAAKTTTKLTGDDSQDIIPMWVGERVYFLSERADDKASGRTNLYSVSAKGGDIQKHTDYADFDIKFPSANGDKIVFEKGGAIHVFDPAVNQATRVRISVIDDGAGTRPTTRNVGDKVGAYELSPDGKKALLASRGDIFVVPPENGLTRNLTSSAGVHDRNPKWSPDGKSIAWISDASGEDEIVVAPADGSKEPQAVTGGQANYKWQFAWSPDSKRIAWTDRAQRLQLVELETKKVTLVAQSKGFEINQFAWSPDSKHVAFVLPVPQEVARVQVYTLDTGKTTPVTDGFYSASDPLFSGDGKYLFFVSNRDFNPTYSQTEWNHVYTDMERIYAIPLTKDAANPFLPKLDDAAEAEKAPEPKRDGDKKDEPKKDDKKKEEKKKDAPIEFDGIIERVIQLPVPAGNYGALASVGSTVYYVRGGRGGALFAAYDLPAKKETVFGAVGGYEISADGKRVLLSVQGKLHLIDLPKGPLNLGTPLNTAEMEVPIDRAAEWAQIFAESWRQMRDFFYDPGLHGVDWPAVRKAYEPLVAHAKTRADLSYVIGEMISELNCGHAYVGDGELATPKRTPMGLLGATLDRDAASGHPVITKILKGSSWDRAVRAPLAEVGMNVKVGEHILAVNGKPTNKVPNVQALLANTANKPVVLTIGKPGEAGRKVTVTPVADESSLYYHEWVETNRRKVSEATGGEVGYLHVPDMGPKGLNEFIKAFYPQIGKKGLIIDVRGNGGGNVSPMLIERLRREPAMYSQVRNGAPGVEPAGTFNGPLVCLLNEFSASDGDLFPWRFKHYKLGPLIGKRSWGGTVGIRGTLPFLDGGTLNRPEFSRFGLDGKTWIIEGYGVDPDIVVDNDPAREYAGDDQQLTRGIEEALKRVKAEYRPLPPTPVYPKR